MLKLRQVPFIDKVLKEPNLMNRKKPKNLIEKR